MKTDLVTAIGVAVLGVLVAYFGLSALFSSDGGYEYTFRSIDASSISNELEEPNPEIFNYKALNPTVEVYVGNCTNYNDAGECVENQSEEEQPDQPNNGDEEQ